MSNNSNDYLVAIKQFIELAKVGDRAPFLNKPTTTSLRDYCFFLVKEGLNTVDEINFRYFLGLNKEADLVKEIKKIQADKFKQIKKFIDGELDNTSSDKLELIAILIDFNPRPYSKFLKQYKTVVVEPIFEANVQEQLNDAVVVQGLVNIETKTPENKDNTKLIVVLLLLIVVLGSVGYLIKDIFLREKRLMEWKSNHYEVVDDTGVNGIGNFRTIAPYDESKMSLKKIDVNSETPFFHYDTPLVYYLKHNGEVEFFNQPGQHPVLKKTLRPVTQHIISVYVNKK